MKYAREFITSTVVGGLFVVVPVYLAALLLLKGMKSVGTLVRPFAALVPDWIPAENFFALILILVVCFVVGLAVRTPSGRSVRERLEILFFERLPGYSLLRSLTQRMAGDTDEQAWTPALVEIEDALVPGFVIEYSTTADTRSWCRPCRHRSLEPCTSSSRNGCTSSTSLSPKPFGPSPAGVRVEGARGCDAKRAAGSVTVRP